MVNYASLRFGDTLRIIGPGAPEGYANLGDIVHVIDPRRGCVFVKNEHGVSVEFSGPDGAESLEPAS